MAQTIERTRTTSPGSGRSGGSGFMKFLTGIVVLAVLAAVGYAVKDQIPGLGTQPTAQTLPATVFTEYEKFWNDRSLGVPPPELSIGTVTAMANDCLYGSMPRNMPQFLDADSAGRARAGWVCLAGTPVPIETPSCNAPGSTRTTVRFTIQRGHLVAARLGGRGDAVDSSGRCTNITAARPGRPIDRQTNSQMRSGMETTAFDRAAAGEVILYLSVPMYQDDRLTPMAVHLFVFGEAGPAYKEYQNPKHLWQEGPGAL